MTYPINPDDPLLTDMEVTCRANAAKIDGRTPIKRWRRHTLISTAHCAMALCRGSFWDAATSTMNREEYLFSDPIVTDA